MTTFENGTPPHGAQKKQRYADILNDFMFKRLFGSEANKDILISFLNEMLEDVEIEDVTFIPTEKLGEIEDDRKSVFDISCRCRDGKIFIVEMQRAEQRYFRDRALYYSCYPVMEQGRIANEEHIKRREEESSRLREEIERAKAEGRPLPKEPEEHFRWNYKLNPVVFVAILNFTMEHEDGWEDGEFRSSYRVREDRTHEVMSENLRFLFLELGRFNKSEDELETISDKWMYVFKNMSKLSERPACLDEPEFERLFILSEIAKFDAEEYKIYKQAMMTRNDYLNAIDFAAEKAYDRGLHKGEEIGRAEGEAKGLETGLTRGREEIIQKMLASGMSAEQVAAIVGIPVEELMKPNIKIFDIFSPKGDIK